MSVLSSCSIDLVFYYTYKVPGCFISPVMQFLRKQHLGIKSIVILHNVQVIKSKKKIGTIYLENHRCSQRYDIMAQGNNNMNNTNFPAPDEHFEM